jgi:hypothetical protein
MKGTQSCLKELGRCPSQGLEGQTATAPSGLQLVSTPPLHTWKYGRSLLFVVVVVDDVFCWYRGFELRASPLLGKFSTA